MLATDNISNRAQTRLKRKWGKKKKSEDALRPHNIHIDPTLIISNRGN